ncbi:hypothetical protein [Pseudoclavibacter sp. AY1H1]|uniref:hypothetical protein n=1 Tax=Pseudoclavibacter sp. AY1H1 TaxID=2080584 RepID=UPI000CE7DACD|nr:hypothetical protein [Pseudoclavibacter sp. AY1H1]PPF39974.1 hypothetical protein C5E05_01815 [Pseudoclavibacter sp. AY1H1]
MSTPIRPPDVEGIVLDYLKSFVDASVVSKRPDDGTTSFVRVIGTGGPGRSQRILQTVQLTIDSYAPTLGLAFDLAQDVDAAIHALPSSNEPVNSVPWSTTPRNDPDPDTQSPRYTATYQLVVICH